jgi:hypothetical protein
MRNLRAKVGTVLGITAGLLLAVAWWLWYSHFLTKGLASLNAESMASTSSGSHQQPLAWLQQLPPQYVCGFAVCAGVLVMAQAAYEINGVWTAEHTPGQAEVIGGAGMRLFAGLGLLLLALYLGSTL